MIYVLLIIKCASQGSINYNTSIHDLHALYSEVIKFLLYNNYIGELSFKRCMRIL